MRALSPLEDHRSCFGVLTKLVAVCCVVFLVLYFNLEITNYNNGTPRALSSGHHRRQTTRNVNKSVSYSVGRVWPRNDIGSYDDRILSQIKFINLYFRRKRRRKLKIILRVGNFNFEDWLPGQQKFVSQKCPIVDCWMTKDRSYARDADALLISEFNKNIRHLYLPKPRLQIWIAQHKESPLHNRIDPYSVRGLINWTASYRHDSTIVLRYYVMAPSVRTTAAATSGGRFVNYAAGKSKLVAWFVSNCASRNGRMRYGRELSRFIKVWHNRHMIQNLLYAT